MTESTQGPSPENEAVARAFHEAYEDLAPGFGYETREASAKPWADVPEQNRALMTATVGRLLESGVISARPAAPAVIVVEDANGDEWRHAAPGAAVGADGTLVLGAVDTVGGIPVMPNPVGGYAPRRWVRFHADGTLLPDELGTALHALQRIRDWAPAGSPEHDIAAAALSAIIDDRPTAASASAQQESSLSGTSA